MKQVSSYIHTGIKIRHLIAVIFTLSVLNCQTAETTVAKPQSKPGWTKATGVAGIVDNNVGKAKDEALYDAKVSAVKQVLGTLISSRTDVADGEFLSTQITAKSEGFIEQYEVLEARAVSSFEYRVTILAKVSEAKLNNAIEEMIRMQGRPLMAVILEEDIMGKKAISAQSVAGTELESILVDQGFPLVDKGTIDKIIARQKAKIKEALGGNDAAARELGELAGAEIILVGYSVVKSAGNIGDSKLISAQADLGIRAIEVSTGQILAATQKHGASAHISEHTAAVQAIQKASRPASDALVDSISKKWKPGKANVIDVLIIGIDYEGATRLRGEMLEKIRGVQAVHRKSADGKVVKLQVEFQGTAFVLVDRMMEAKLSVKLKPGEVTRGSADFTVVQ